MPRRRPPPTSRRRSPSPSLPTSPGSPRRRARRWGTPARSSPARAAPPRPRPRPWRRRACGWPRPRRRLPRSPSSCWEDDRMEVTGLSFARGAPSLDIIDVDGLAAAAQRAFANDPGGMTAYGTAVGYVPLRRWIAERHGVDEAQVLVTNGSMQADAFLFDELVAAGDEVIVERPSYDRTLLALRQRGAAI